MSSVKNIKNFTVSAQLGAGSDFWRPIQLGFQPTDAIIRQISYNGAIAVEGGVFLIWCSLINDFIGSFQINNFGVTLQPRVQIHMHSPLLNSLQFKIYTVRADGTATPTTALAGDLVVLIDFIQN